MKGWQLLKEIEEGNIKEGTKINVSDILGYLLCTISFENEKLNWKNGEFDATFLVNNIYDFEIIEEQIEEQEEINIQDIEEIKWRASDEEYLPFGVSLANDKINQLIKAIKQLDKQVKENK